MFRVQGLGVQGNAVEGLSCVLGFCILKFPETTVRAPHFDDALPEQDLGLGFRVFGLRVWGFGFQGGGWCRAPPSSS